MVGQHREYMPTLSMTELRSTAKKYETLLGKEDEPSINRKAASKAPAYDSDYNGPGDNSDDEAQTVGDGATDKPATSAAGPKTSACATEKHVAEQEQRGF